MIDPTLSSLLSEKTHPLLSYEFFPPKTDAGIKTLQKTVSVLKQTSPDFVTITYGAGGSTRDKTLQVAELLRESGFSPVMPHLTCVASTRKELECIARDIYENGFRNIMALRGDPPQGFSKYVPTPEGLRNAQELVALLKKIFPDLCCGVAGYPEMHPEAHSTSEDIRYLKSKVNAGASFITTQLFFNNNCYIDFVKSCRSMGIRVPIIPGLMLAHSLKQVVRFTEMCGSSFPIELARRMENVGGDGADAEKEGIQWCCKQIRELLDFGVPAIHLYILNRAKAVNDSEFLLLLQEIRKTANPDNTEIVPPFQ